MRWLRLFFRAFGWLLTPFMAWAASFFGCVAGAMLATRIRDPITGVIVTAVLGGLAGFTGLMAWLHLLRSSPEIREVLAVTEDGTPDTTSFEVPQALQEPSEPGRTEPGRAEPGRAEAGRPEPRAIGPDPIEGPKR